MAGKDIIWIKFCMKCTRELDMEVSFNETKGRGGYEEHMAAHEAELTGKATK